MKASVIIPTLEREPYTIQSIEDLLGLPQKDFEIVVIDQSDVASSKIKALSEKNPNRIFYFHENFKSLPQARNCGVQKAHTDKYIFIDDDVRIDATFYEEHMRALTMPGVELVAGKIRQPGLKPRPKFIFTRWLGLPTNGSDSNTFEEAEHAGGGNFSLHRATWEKVGGFDESMGEGTALYEELDFCLKLRKMGGRIVYNPKASLLHIAAPSGGCRVLDIEKYMLSLNRNRTIIICRFVPIYFWPTAFIRMWLLNFSYWRSERKIYLKSLIEGMRLGFQISRMKPKVSRF